MTSLIIGCGFLGKRLAARLLQRGQVVYGTTTSVAGATPLAVMGVRPLILTVTQPLTLAAMRPVLEEPSLDVYYLVPPGGRRQGSAPRQVVIDGMAAALRALSTAQVHRAVLASTTAVYEQAEGESVDADTEPMAESSRAKLLLEGERQWLAAGPAYRVVRFSGLYGPGRVIGRAALRDGAPLVGDPEALINLIHVDDAAELMIAVAASDSAARVELGCDDHPVRRLDYYRYLAHRTGAGDPIVLNPDQAQEILGLSAERLRRTANKRCDSSVTRRRTGWAPRYADYRAGLEQALTSDSMA